MVVLFCSLIEFVDAWAEYSPCYKVKHEGMVRDGRVRNLDRLGNSATDEAADFGRRRVDFTCY